MQHILYVCGQGWPECVQVFVACTSMHSYLCALSLAQLNHAYRSDIFCFHRNMLSDVLHVPQGLCPVHGAVCFHSQMLIQCVYARPLELETYTQRCFHSYRPSGICRVSWYVHNLSMSRYFFLRMDTWSLNNTGSNLIRE